MKISLAVLVCLTLCTPLLAQNKVVSSPPGYETKGQLPESRTWGYHLGQFANERFQAADALFRKNVMILKEISYRLDQRDYKATGTSAGVGRKWTNVTLTMSECDYDKVTSTFSTNSLTSRSVVFNSSMAWVTQVGVPATNPAPWGGKGIKFPFSTNWLYTGSNDILLDYVFLGGTLDNNAAWASPASTSKRYYLDGFYSATYATGPKTTYPASAAQTTPPYCVDSGQKAKYPTHAAYNNILGITVYNGDGSQPPGEISFSWRTFYTAKSAPVIQALGLAGLPTGVDIGAGCNKVYLNLNLPWVPILQANTGSYTTGWTNLKGMFVPVMAGFPLWFQSAWTDSVTGKFSLSTATQATFPAAIPPVGPRRQALYSYDPTSATATSGPNPNGRSWGSNPMYLITYQ